ncbi:MAG: GldG family protein [Polyangiaceae bacterium]
MKMSRAVDRGMGLSGIAAAAFLVIVGNVLAARHFTRWDFTTDRRYTLSEPTRATLRELSEPVHVWLLAGSAEPLGQAVRQLLVAYEAESRHVDVHVVDPDRDVAALEDLRNRFRLETGRTEQGGVVTDAMVIVECAGKTWFLRPADLVDASEAEDGKVRPREEEALTLAFRNVIRGDKGVVCFTTGHGELSLDAGGEEGLRAFRSILEKNNFDVRPVDTRTPGTASPFDGCRVVAVVGPRGSFSTDEAERLRTYALLGGNVFVAAGPDDAASPDGPKDAGLGRVTGPFGIALGEGIVVEGDPTRTLPGGRGLQFFAAAREHSLTTGLSRIEDAKEAPRVVVLLARPVRAVPETGASAPVDLLATSARAFTIRSLAGASTTTADFARPDGAPAGPFALAMLSERPKIGPSSEHGPRMVVFGATSLLAASSFASPWAVHGGATLVENAVAWLAAKPVMVDVPSRNSAAFAMRISSDSKSEIRTYVLVTMPLAIVLLGLAIFFRRRATEGRPEPRP